MRRRFEEQLETLHTTMVRMGALCEEAISEATQALLKGPKGHRKATRAIEADIIELERELEQLCVRLLMTQQPVASDLRHITAAQRIIIDMERIGDQAANIAELARSIKGSQAKSDVHIADMAEATIKMLSDAIDAFVHGNLELARSVLAFDDVVDALFISVRDELVDEIRAHKRLASDCMDLLMIAKYYERIADHAESIADWVVYWMTGQRHADELEAAREAEDEAED